MKCSHYDYRNQFRQSKWSFHKGNAFQTINNQHCHNRIRQNSSKVIYKLRNRTFTAEKEILDISAKEGYRHFFYGSTEETLEKLQKHLGENYPGVQIAGMYSPPFRSLTEEEDKEIIRMINESQADFVWIGLGAPKQERWMSDHKGIISGFMVGVGAAFDYLAGNITRAPEWMQKTNLEWLYRLMQEPKRLFKRYFYTNTKFIWNAVILGK